MLKKIIGYFLAIIGLIGFGFFEHYEGFVILYPSLWFALSILIGLAGVYLIARSKLDKTLKQKKDHEERVNNLKQCAENILLTVDNCEIRENKYYKQGPASDSTPELFEPAQKPVNHYRQEYIEQSAIIYYYKTNDETIRMTSQSFPFNAKVLTDIIESKKLFLYVSRFDKNDYVFDFADSIHQTQSSKIV